MNAARTSIAIALMVLAAYVVVVNWGCLILSARNKRNGVDRHYSTVPLVAAILATLAFVAYPFSPKGWIAMIPVCDPASWSTLVALPVVLWKEFTATRKDPPTMPPRGEGPR